MSKPVLNLGTCGQVSRAIVVEPGQCPERMSSVYGGKLHPITLACVWICLGKGGQEIRKKTGGTGVGGYGEWHVTGRRPKGVM